MPGENVILCDTKGPVYKGRQEGMNQWKSAHAVDTEARSLAEAMVGADVVFGLSQKGTLTKDMIASMAKNPIIFAMANPDPEITPEEVAQVRDDAIMATGRSDYPNQVNNVLGFPYIFRGALDVRATTINDEMKLAAAEALAALAREDVPDEVAAAYQGNRPRFGPRYIIPVPFDPRLISAIPPAVAEAAMRTGVARRPIADMEAYRQQLSARRDPVAGTLQQITARVRRRPQRVVFAEGEEEQVIRAAVSFVSQRLGTAILVGREDLVTEQGGGRRHRPEERHRDHERAPLDAARRLCRLPLRAPAAEGLPVPRLRAAGQHRPQPFRRLHGGARRRRRARDRRDAQLLLGDGGPAALHRPEARPPRHRRLDRASAAAARSSSPTPRCTTCRTPRSSPTSPRRRPAWRGGSASSRASRCSPIRPSAIRSGERAEKVQEAVRILDQRHVDFEYDGEMGADVALNPNVMAAYPFCRLSGPGQRAGHAGAALGGDLHQHAAGARRLDRARAAARRLRPPGADPADLGARLPTSPTWRRSRRTTSAGEAQRRRRA